MRQLTFNNYAISNSEVNCFMTCRRKHSYEFILRLTPERQATALYRGISGHEVLEAYYQSLLEGNSLPVAEAVGLAIIDNMITQEIVAGNEITVLMQLRDVLVGYFGYASDDDWEILAVEKSFIHEYDGVPIGMRLDLLAKPRTGKWAGEVLLIDHKFSYQDWSDKDVDINGQPYKYVKILGDNGIHVDRVMYNIIKYRSKNDLVSRKTMMVKPVEAQVAIKDHVVIAKEIQALRNKVDAQDQDGRDDWRDVVPRVMNKYVCGMCSFYPVCKAEMSGRTKATELMIDLEYRANDYGYELGGEQ